MALISLSFWGGPFAALRVPLGAVRVWACL